MTAPEAPWPATAAERTVVFETPPDRDRAVVATVVVEVLACGHDASSIHGDVNDGDDFGAREREKKPSTPSAVNRLKYL